MHFELILGWILVFVVMESQDPDDWQLPLSQLPVDPDCEHYRQYRRLVVLFFLVFSKFLLDISSSRVKRWQTRFILS